MSSIAALNKALQRQLKPGNEYNKYFSNVSCKATFLGEGVTSFGLQKMKQWALQYQGQTKAIANVLKKATIPATALNIKNFLYDHLQYSADGWDQNLRSPNCSWQTRKEGIDCKSYSIFASTILLNLGIKHSFRKITQPNSPNKWSHVYVVVKHNNSELIIDATVPYNYEVAKVKQEDLSMEQALPYHGLNAVASTGLVVNKKTYEVATALDNLQIYLDELEQKGVSKQTTDAIWYEVKSYLQQGKEPKLQITPNFISIENKRFEFGVGLNGFFGDLLDAGADVASGGGSGVIGTLTSLFSNIGRTSDSAGITRIVQPLQKHIESLLASASPSNLHLKLTEADKHISATIKHEEKVNSRFSAVALPELRKMLQELRSKYASFSTIPTSSNGNGLQSWWTSGATLVHAGTVNHNQYLPTANAGGGNFNFSPTAQVGSNNTINELVKLANGLFVNPQTNQTYTPEQAQQFMIQNAQTGIRNTQNAGGLSTGAWVGIGVGALVIGALVAKKMNII